LFDNNKRTKKEQYFYFRVSFIFKKEKKEKYLS